MKTKQEVLAANRARSYNWRTDLNYKMSELNPDPKMRPSVDALIHKLRTMSMLRNHPEAATLVIGDLAYHYLYSEAPRPAHLWSLMVRMMNLWQMATKAPLPNDQNIAMLQEVGQSVPQAVLHQLSYRVIGGQRIWHCACGSDFYSAADYDAHQEAVKSWRSIGTEPGNDSAGTTRWQDPSSVPTAIDSSSGSPTQPESGEDTGFSLADKLKTERRNLSRLIWDHVPTPGGLFIDCGCGREFGDYDAWANHTRIRIERYLLNQFANDSSD